MKCSVIGCERDVHARNYCDPHYRKFKKFGDPEHGWQRTPGQTVEDRFWSKVDKRHPSECWNWQRAKDSSGYGNFWCGARIVGAHRYAWFLTHGECPEGLELDHLCHNRSCVNPDHLRAVSHLQNVQNLRGPRKDSKHGGGRGLSWRKGKWMVRVSVDGVRKFFGSYESQHQAECVAIAARAMEYADSPAAKEAAAETLRALRAAPAESFEAETPA